MRKSYIFGLTIVLGLWSAAYHNLQAQIENKAAIQVACPTSVNVLVNRGVEATMLNYALPTGYSECTGNDVIRTLMQGPASGEQFRVGATQIVYSFADTCGNEVFCSFVINVLPTVSEQESNVEAASGGSRNSVQNISLTGVRIWPNPTGETLYIQFPQSLESKQAIFRVVDAKGQIVLTKHAELSGNMYSLQLPAGISSGLYFLEAQIDQSKMEWIRFSVVH
ncbi:MAG: T9SS type A sorting domain-containing protein [Saprospiraceae bacterium]